MTVEPAVPLIRAALLMLKVAPGSTVMAFPPIATVPLNRDTVPSWIKTPPVV
jgi:hypothetical protein